MARKLRPEEAEVFNGAIENGQIPTDPDAFLRSLTDPRDKAPESNLIPGLWLEDPNQKPLGS